MTAYASLETALETMRQGAYDYIIKPFQTEELLLLVRRLEETQQLRKENSELRSYLSNVADDIVGESEPISRVKGVIESLSESDAAVLIRGESGTGKELVAKAIHRAPRRAEAPFIAVNCAAIPESLLESELFGYEKGAFTGADRNKLGHFQLANGGTLFLDEIGDLPLSLQAKLLRVLEDQRVSPLGSEQSVQVDVRLVSATHSALEGRHQGWFVSPGPVLSLKTCFRLTCRRCARDPATSLSSRVHLLSQWGRNASDLSHDACAVLSGYSWPGNVRELRNVLERAVIMKPSGTIEKGDIMIGDAPQSQASAPIDTLNLADAERAIIERALEAAGGNKSEAARLLGITRRALYGRLERHGLD